MKILPKCLFLLKEISKPPISAKFNCCYQTPFCTTLTILHSQQVNETMAGKGKSKRNRSIKGNAQSNQLKKKRSLKATNGLNNDDDAASSIATGGVAVDPTVNNNTTNEMNAVDKVASFNATRGVAVNPTINEDATNGMNAVNNAASSDATRGVAVNSTVNSTVNNDTGGGATSSNNAETN
jgi:hypothetical protein